MSAFAGVVAGLLFYFLYRTLLSGFYTVQQNERAVVTGKGDLTLVPGGSAALVTQLLQQ